MLAVYPWAFLIYGIGTPETLEQIRVNEAHFFICDYLGLLLWAYGEKYNIQWKRKMLIKIRKVHWKL